MAAVPREIPAGARLSLHGMAATTASSSSALGLEGVTTHPVYQTWAPIWRKLAHVVEGAGGFLDGTYLVAHPREYLDHSTEVEVTLEDGTRVKRIIPNDNPTKPSRKLKARRKLARYENLAALILENKVSTLFRELPSRQVGSRDPDAPPHEYTRWLDDVDGAGTNLDDFLKLAWWGAATFGHVFVVFDQPVTAQQARTRAEQPQPFLSLYTPLDVPDWLIDERGTLTAVKLVEAIPRTDFRAPRTEAAYRVRVITDREWRVEDVVGGEVADPVDGPRRGEHNLGRLPVVPLYAKRRPLTPVIGLSILGDPQLYVDDYNLTSEIRELLRNQTFGILNAPLGTGDAKVDVSEAQAMLGQSVGTANVAFSPLPMQFLSPDTGNVTVYQEEQDRLRRMIYRITSTPWEADSRDAEAEGSLRLKREDLYTAIAGYADELERAEYAIAELWFRARYGADWQREWDAAQVLIRYPERFDPEPFEKTLEQAQASSALSLGRSKTFQIEQAKRLLPQFLPDLSEETAATIVEELEAMPSPEEERRQRAEALMAQFRGRDLDVDEPEDPAPPQAEEASA